MLSHARVTIPMYAGLLLLGAVVSAACSGKFQPEDGGSAGSSGSAGSAGSGGAVADGGGTGGAGGSGTGGGIAGGGGTGGGLGGSGGGEPCTVLPDCNWCGGSIEYDGNGCELRYVCANGANPCQTSPCDISGCPDGTACGPDRLCWPKEPLECDEMTCMGSTDGDCICRWSCNGAKYETNCKSSGGGTSCTCTQDGYEPGACAGSEQLSCGSDCCGFPHPK